MIVRLTNARYGGATEGADESGDGVLVSGGIPGELVECERSSGGQAAESVSVIEASSERVAPKCVHFGVCGGCQYQHVDDSAQVALKAGILLDLLTSAGLKELPAIQVHSGEPWGYRNRVQMRFATVDGVLRVGYSRRACNEFLPVAMCPIAAPVLWRSAEALTRLAASDAACARWLGAMTEVEIFAVADESRVQMSFLLRDAEVARQEPERFAGFCERVKAAIPELAGAGVGMDPELGRRARRAWDGDSWGAAGLAYEAAGKKYWVSRGAFFQVNRFLVDELVSLVTDGRSGQLAWDLFAGVGLFSQALAERFAEVVAVEGAEGSARDLAALAKSVKGGKIVPVHSPTLAFLQERVIQRERPHLIVMDPPRAGVGVEGCAVLGRLKVPEMVYVSCDPVTLARDLKVLVSAGYVIVQVHLVDLFPQTFHMETVCMLRYRG